MSDCLLFFLLYNEDMKKVRESIVEGIYEGIQKSEQHKDQISKQEIESLVASGMISFINKTAVLLGATFIYIFYRVRGVDGTSIFIMFLTFWMAWVIQGNHLSKLQKLLDTHKKENK